jgi:ABC-type glycerol-3-phosphate transport system substrate-binding protein
MKTKILICSVLIFSLLLPQTIASAEGTDSSNKLTEQVVEDRYHEVLNNWKKEGFDSIQGFEGAVEPSTFINIDEANLLSESKSEGYGDSVFHWHNQNEISFEVEVDKEGFYELAFDYYPLGNGLVPIEGAIQVNGEYPFYESRRVVFPVNWKSSSDSIEKDRYGNEIIPNQEEIREWQTIKAEDSSHLEAAPLKYLLKKGKNTITLTNLRGELLLGNVYVQSPREIPSYNDYLKDNKGELVTDTLEVYETEHPLRKNSSYLRPIATKEPSATPYDTNNAILNTFGGESWKTSGQSATWKIDVEKDGYYHLSFKVLQNKPTGAPVFRSILIDGEVPFSEVATYKFPHSKDWENIVIGESEDKPYTFYFTKGSHEITLVADASPMQRVLNQMDDVMQEIEELSLSIRKLTGNQTDQSRGWEITEYIPDIEDRLNKWASVLSEEAKYLKTLSESEDDTQEIVTLKLAVDKLKKLADEPDEVPARMTELSEGSSSVSTLLGDLQLDLQNQQLLIDRFYVYGNEDLPKPEAGWFKKTVEAVKRFFLSFTEGSYSTANDNEEAVEVWVNRPRQYVELMQNMADKEFTPETGIEVKFSLMPDEQKLILANAADAQPDVALGVSSYLPYELAIRGAVVDLRKFDDFGEVISDFSPGAFMPLIIEDEVYALPETQDFFVTFYRKDILGALNIPVPGTWAEVTEILPELQRFGMNYFTPMSAVGGFKTFQTTLPYIYQFQGKLYAENGMTTAIDSEESLEAIEFMTELNTIYSLPIEVPNFYNHFRYSTLPIGISSFNTYIQLTTAAPEIAGWWDIAPYPGKKQEDGTIERWATGSGTTGMIFKGSEKQEDGWELLKWWMETETQSEFATSLQTMFGPEYMWNTANVEAFRLLPWPEEHKQVILKQWEYLHEVPKTPATYMVERELSNIWNKIVFDGENTRSTVDDSIITINRELARKMEEFGYMKDGKMVKPYPIPTIELVESWVENNEE